MKKLFLLAISLFAYSIAFAQVKPIYFYGSTIIADSTKATSYGIYGKVSEGIWVIKMYNLYNELMSTGSFKDAELKIEHGEFVYYSDYRDFNEENNTSFFLKDKVRFISQKGTYIDGKETGKWQWFYPNGKLMTILTFDDGHINGPYYKYDVDGNVLETGNFVQDKRDGEWFYKRGKKKETYVMGILQLKNKNKKERASATIQ